MKKVLKLIVVLLLVAIIAFLFFAGPIIKNTVNSAGPSVLGVPVSVEDVDLSLLQGVVRLNDLRVGNPEGFDTKNLFTMKILNVELSMASLFSDKIHVKTVEVIGPEITYERNLTESNIGAFQEQLSKGKKEKPEEPEVKKEGKKVMIDYFVLDDCRVNLSLPGMGDKTVPLPLPKLELRDIGKGAEEGATFTDVIRNIFRAIFAAVADLVKGSGRLVGEGVKAVGSGAAKVGGAAVDGAAKVGGAAVDGASKVGGAAVDGVSKVGGAAVDGVSKVGGAAVDGVSAVGKGIANIFGGGGDKEPEAEEGVTNEKAE